MITKKDLITGASVALIFYGALRLVGCDATPPKCVETKTVTRILELQYRDAVIELDDGSHTTVNQAWLSPGDSICVKYKQ